jgi:hypothetical protein
MAPKWLGDKITRFESNGGLDGRITLEVRHRRHASLKTGKISHQGWICFEPSLRGTIDNKRELRRLARAILKAIGDVP